MRRFAFAAGLALLAGAAALPAQATLVGDTIRCSAMSGDPVFPLGCNPSEAVVGPGAEFTLEDRFIPNNPVELLIIDPGTASVMLRNEVTFPVTFLQGDHVTLSDLDWVGEPLAVLVGIANFSTNVAGADSSDILVGPSSLTIDLSDLVFAPGGFITFDLVKGTAVIPLPATGLLLLAGLAGLGLLRRQRAA